MKKEVKNRRKSPKNQ